MRVVDEAILTVIRATGVDINDGLVDVAQNRVVSYPLPYAVFHSSLGDDHSTRLTGRTGRRSVFFTIMYVGLNRNQAKACGERVRDAITERRLEVPGHKVWLVELLDSQRVRRDDDAIRPDGGPLFYGVDNYAVSITKTPMSQEAP